MIYWSTLERVFGFIIVFVDKADKVITPFFWFKAKRYLWKKLNCLNSEEIKIKQTRFANVTKIHLVYKNTLVMTNSSRTLGFYVLCVSAQLTKCCCWGEKFGAPERACLKKKLFLITQYFYKKVLTTNSPQHTLIKIELI